MNSHQSGEPASYWILAGDDSPEFCSIYSRPDDLVNPLRLRRGRPMADSFQEGIEFHMANEVPGFQIPDVIANLVGYLMISQEMKDFLEARATEKIDFHRFKLLNHKGRVASDEVYIANVLRKENCADMKETAGIPSRRREGEFMRIDRLALDSDRIPDEANIFRLGERPSIILVSDPMKSDMEEAGLSAKFYAPEDRIQL